MTNEDRMTAPRLAYRSAPALANLAIGAMLRALRANVDSRGWRIDELTALTQRLLLSGKSLPELCAFMHVLVPAPSPATGQPDPLADIEGLHPGVASAEESRLLAVDVVTFCPIPLPSWQDNAAAALQSHLGAWREKLRYLRDTRREGSIQQVPFLRFLVQSDEPEAWATMFTAEVNLADVLDRGGNNRPTPLTALRRPFIGWPTDARIPGHHVATMPTANVATRLGMRLLPSLVSAGPAEFIRPHLDISPFRKAMDVTEYRPSPSNPGATR